MSLEDNLSYKFKNESLLKEALTHPSFSNEHNLAYNYERLEFLGDAILEAISSDYIYKNFASLHEGAMTQIRAYAVCETSLSNIARSLKIDDYILLGKGEIASSGFNNDTILADIFEAIIGAIYTDSDFFTVQKIITPLLIANIYEACSGTTSLNDKGKLQEITQKRFDCLPIYSIIDEVGPDHDKTYTVQVEVKNIFKAIGSGKSKKLAEKNAALNAIKLIKG